jgi:hypothetical protein
MEHRAAGPRELPEPELRAGVAGSGARRGWPSPGDLADGDVLGQVAGGDQVRGARGAAGCMGGGGADGVVYRPYRLTCASRVPSLPAR